MASEDNYLQSFKAQFRTLGLCN